MTLPPSPGLSLSPSEGRGRRIPLSRVLTGTSASTTGMGSTPADIVALGWPGQVFAPGEWGRIVNGGAWLTVDGTKVDLIYRDLDEVLHWTAAAGEGQFEIHREVGRCGGDRHIRAGWGNWLLAGCWPGTCPTRCSRRSCARPRLLPGSRARSRGAALRRCPRRTPGQGRLPGEPVPGGAGHGPGPSRRRRRMGAQREAACPTCWAGRRSRPARAA